MSRKIEVKKRMKKMEADIAGQLATMGRERKRRNIEKLERKKN